MLSITPMMTNDTNLFYNKNGDIVYDDDGVPVNAVAFSTISQNATFYAALLYDVGADLSVFFDGALGGWYFDFTTGQF